MEYLEITPTMVKQLLFENKKIYVVIFDEFEECMHHFSEGLYCLSTWKLGYINVLLKCGGNKVKYFIEDSKNEKEKSLCRT